MLKKSNGFSLIELIAVIAITAVLALPLLAMQRTSREHALEVGCANNLRTIYAAIQNYADDNEGYLMGFANNIIFDDGQYFKGTWEDVLVPYLYQYTGYVPFYYYGETPFNPMVFYCPKRWEAWYRYLESGYWTNYTINANIFGMPPLRYGSNPPDITGEPVQLHNINEFEDQDNIVMLIEVQDDSEENNAVFIDLGSNPEEELDYSHYNRTHMLMLNGTVKKFKKQTTIPVKLTDGYAFDGTPTNND